MGKPTIGTSGRHLEQTNLGPTPQETMRSRRNSPRLSRFELFFHNLRGELAGSTARFNPQPCPQSASSRGKSPRVRKQNEERFPVDRHLTNQLDPDPVRTVRDLAELDRSFLQSRDLVGAVCFDGRLQHANPAWTTCLGWTVDELRAKRLLELVHADDRADLKAAVAKLSEGTETVAFETRSQHRDGSYCWVRWSANTQWERRLIRVRGQDITELRRLECQILQIVDDERERLSSELHDGLCQTLAGIAALSATLARKTGADCTSGVSATAAEITELLHQAVHQARGLARGLGPPILRHTDLAGGLEILASHVEHRFGISCVFQTGFPLPALPPETEAHLFRMAQEATRNAVTHGQCNDIAIKLSFTNELGHLRVLDDGVGLPDEEPLPDGIGLETMAYRARLIGASFEVRRRARHGTEVSCVFPLTKMPESR